MEFQGKRVFENAPPGLVCCYIYTYTTEENVAKQPLTYERVLKMKEIYKISSPLMAKAKL